MNKKIFQSPFSGDFLCFTKLFGKTPIIRVLFQSPFSGDFLCFVGTTHASHTRLVLSFNLHFQETFFVSDEKQICYTTKQGDLSISIFRRLSLFPTVINYMTKGAVGLSISIFRRLSLFHVDRFLRDLKRKLFQSPFSGDFLCF